MSDQGPSSPCTLGDLVVQHEQQLRRGLVTKGGGPVLLEVTRLESAEEPVSMTAFDPTGATAPRSVWSTQKIEVTTGAEAARSGRVEDLETLVPVTDSTARVFSMVKAALNDSPNLCVGRAKRNDIRVQDNSVSSVQAYFETGGEIVHLVDMNSANGTYVNGTQLKTGVPAPIKSGDALRFGNTVFYYLNGYRFLLFLDLFLQDHNAAS